MEAFQNNFPAMFPEYDDITNDTEAQSNNTDHRCSSGSGGSRDFLVVNTCISRSPQYYLYSAVDLAPKQGEPR